MRTDHRWTWCLPLHVRKEITRPDMTTTPSPLADWILHVRENSLQQTTPMGREYQFLTHYPKKGAPPPCFHISLYDHIQHSTTSWNLSPTPQPPPTTAPQQPKLHIHLLSGQTWSITYHPQLTGGEIYSLLRQHTPYSDHDVYITAQGRLLNREETIQQQSIHPDDRLRIQGRLRGGAEEVDPHQHTPAEPTEEADLLQRTAAETAPTPVQVSAPTTGTLERDPPQQTPAEPTGEADIPQRTAAEAAPTPAQVFAPATGTLETGDEPTITANTILGPRASSAATVASSSSSSDSSSTTPLITKEIPATAPPPPHDMTTTTARTSTVRSATIQPPTQPQQTQQATTRPLHPLQQGYIHRQYCSTTLGSKIFRPTFVDYNMCCFLGLTMVHGRGELPYITMVDGPYLDPHLRPLGLQPGDALRWVDDFDCTRQHWLTILPLIRPNTKLIFLKNTPHSDIRQGQQLNPGEQHPTTDKDNTGNKKSTKTSRCSSRPTPQGQEGHAEVPQGKKTQKDQW